ncbi:MAG: septum formation initiator family protein [Candidatus Acetothermia bacterium]|jgi:cell division protein FtsB|nr:septum formation initiator family protein [Candidatus Acetothermia bacterium]
MGVLLLIGGLGWLFGSRWVAIERTAAELQALRTDVERLSQQIARLQQELAVATRPEVVEREARKQLQWGFPNEERVVVLRR